MFLQNVGSLLPLTRYSDYFLKISFISHFQVDVTVILHCIVGYVVPIVWKALQSLKMPGILYPATQCNIPEDMNLYVNLVSSTFLPFMFKLFEEELLHITITVTVGQSTPFHSANC